MASSYTPVGDAYDQILVKLGYPKSLNLRKLLEVALSEEEAEIYLDLPATPEEMARDMTTLIEISGG